MSNTPTRIQRSRRKGYRMPPNSKSICRPGAWGNPFRVVKNEENYYRVCLNVKSKAAKNVISWILLGSGPSGFKTKSDAAAHAAMLFGEIMDRLPQSYPLSDFDGVENIACFCKEGEPCHGDEIIKRLSKQCE